MEWFWDKNSKRLGMDLRGLCFFWMVARLTMAQDCDYFLRRGYVIQQKVREPHYFQLSVENADQCGEECCSVERCSAAIYRNQDCILIDCDQIGGCDPVKASEETDGFVYIVTRRSTDEDEISSREANNEGEDDLDPAHAMEEDVFSTAETNSTIPTHQTEDGNQSLHWDIDFDLSTDKQTLNSSVVDSVSETVPVKIDPHLPMNQTLDTVPETSIVKETSHEELATVLATTEGSSPTTAATIPTVPIPATVVSSKSPTVPATKPTVTVQKKLSVSTGGNQEIRLPKDSVTIQATVTPQSDTPYDYQWRLIKHPEDFRGTQSGIETQTLKLTTLTVGHYEFKIEVNGDNAYGEAFVNVTVLPKLRVNVPPVAVISPTFQELTLPTDSTVLDGSKSHDDDEIVKYEWEEVQGPLQANINKDEDGNLPNSKVLELTGLAVGNYTFKLTVTDTDKITDSTQAIILVKNKIDNPPIANAGSNQVIHMPQNSAILCGNDSTDDWGIVGYKWSLSTGSKNEVVDMQGARSQCLELSNLEVGDYTFQLTVTDEAGQEDSAKVTIIVQPESNHPPLAKAGEDKQLLLPLDSKVVSAHLDGSKSSDDKEITSILWTMPEGPDAVTIVKDNSLSTAVTGITVAGKYKFTLTVSDEDGASSSDSVIITVKDEQPPTADAGPDFIITLPDNVAMLDGSESSDDHGITEYEWKRSDKSPAAGYILNHSDHQPVLHVAGLVQGTYTFRLKVTNARGKSSEDEAQLTVRPDPLTDNLVELHLDADILHFDETQKQMVIRQLGVLLSLQSDDPVVVESVYSEHGTSHMVILFYVKMKDSKKPMAAAEVTDALNSKLKSDVDFLEFKFLRADTFVCENSCSGHGRCRSGSQECECDIFWMENYFRVFLGDGKRNCEWSVMYVGIVCFILLTILSCSLWFLACFCLRRRQKKSPYRRHKNHSAHEKMKYEKIPLKPHRNGGVRKNGYVRNSAYKPTSIMRSLSSSSSSFSEDGKENTLFERKRLLVSNGNGRINGGFEGDSIRRKTSSSSIGKHSLRGRDPPFAKNGGHQSTFLRVENSSQEEIL